MTGSTQQRWRRDRRVRDGVAILAIRPAVLPCSGKCALRNGGLERGQSWLCLVGRAPSLNSTTGDMLCNAMWRTRGVHNHLCERARKCHARDNTKKTQMAVATGGERETARRRILDPTANPTADTTANPTVQPPAKQIKISNWRVDGARCSFFPCRFPLVLLFFTPILRRIPSKRP